MATSSTSRAIDITAITITIMIMIMMGMGMGMGMVSSSPSPDQLFLHHLHRRCPLPFSHSLPFQTDGAFLEQVMSSTFLNAYATVLFYDSGSPFSNGVRSEFDMLSSMFPQISHIAVEQSLVMPSLFSRYGVHSLPAVFIVNQTEKMRYYGPKDLHSLVSFYKRMTGLEPLYYYVFDDSFENMNSQSALQPWYQLSWEDIMVNEPYLLFAILFLVLRAFFFLCPEIISHVTAFWILCKHRINLGIFGESSQLLGSALHVIDFKRVWSKLKQCKSRNFQKGARSAHVWASSLASVSLRETSARPSSSSIES